MGLLLGLRCRGGLSGLHGGGRVLRHRLGPRRPRSGLRRDLPQLRSGQCLGLVTREVQILGPERLRTAVGHRSGLRRRRGRAAVGQRAHHTTGGVGHGRPHVQRPARRRGRLGLGLGAHGAHVHGARVASTGLVRTRFGQLSGGLRLELGLELRLPLRLVRLTPRTLRAGHQQQIVVFGGALRGVGEGVGTGGGEALLLHHACVPRLSLARDLAGVGHAYPLPIHSAPSALYRVARTETTSGHAVRCERPADTQYCHGRSTPRRDSCHGPLWAAPRCASPGAAVPHRTQNGSFFRTLANEAPNLQLRYNSRPAYPARSRSRVRGHCPDGGPTPGRRPSARAPPRSGCPGRRIAAARTRPGSRPPPGPPRAPRPRRGWTRG